MSIGIGIGRYYMVSVANTDTEKTLTFVLNRSQNGETLRDFCFEKFLLYDLIKPGLKFSKICQKPSKKMISSEEYALKAKITFVYDRFLISVSVIGIGRYQDVSVSVSADTKIRVSVIHYELGFCSLED